MRWRILLSSTLTAFCIGLLLTMPACDKPGKEGDRCKTPTVVSSDCEEGLRCASCDRGPECVRSEGSVDGDRLRVNGRVCEVIRDMRSTSDIPRGQVP